MRSVQLNLGDQPVHMLKEFLESGSRKIAHVLGTTLASPVRNQSSRLEIAEARNLLTLATFHTDYMVTVASDFQGDINGRLLLLMRSRDFSTVCELLSQAMPYMTNPHIDPEHLDILIPDWVRMNEAEYAGSARFRDMLFDAVAELGNMIFGGFLTSAYEIFGTSTYHSVPKAKIDRQQKTLFDIVEHNSKIKRTLLFAENHFTILPYELKLWVLMISDNATSNKLSDGTEHTLIAKALHRRLAKHDS